MSDTNQGIDSNVSEILKTFLGVSRQRISEDLRNLKSSEGGLRDLERHFHLCRGLTPGEQGESYHRRLLLGKKVSLSSRLPADLILFSTTVTAHEIAELSCSVATGRGRLGDLSKRLEVFEEEGGDEEKIRSVVIQSEKLLNRIHDLVFVEILDRYGLSVYGRFFEKNRPLYEVRFEVGRRLVDASLVNEIDHQATVQKFRTLYGPELVGRFLGRLRRHSLIPS